MAITSDHLTGFAVGVGISAMGFYVYKKNQAKVDQFLRDHGIKVSSVLDTDPRTMTLKDLIRAKEELEDFIAEKEHEGNQEKVKSSTKKAK